MLMKKSKLTSLEVIIFVVFSFLMFGLIAQQEPVNPEKGAGLEKVRRRPMMPIIAALDADGDQIIGADEIKNASTALKTLDKNSDDKITEDEMRPQRPDRGDKSQAPAEPPKEGEQPPEKVDEQQKAEKEQDQMELPVTMQSRQRERRPFVLPIMTALDKNQDKVIDSEEIEEAPDSLKTLDKDSDGQLSRDELFPWRSRVRRGTQESKSEAENESK